MNVSIISFRYSKSIEFLIEKLNDADIDLNFCLIGEQTKQKLDEMFSIVEKTSDTIFFVGGAGWSENDILKEYLTAKFNVNSVYTKQAQDCLNKFVKLSKQPMPPVFAQEKLLSFPEGFECFQNLYGYELAAMGNFGGKELVMLPDNYAECEYVFTTYLQKYFFNKESTSTKLYTFKVFGVIKEDVEEKLRDFGRFKSFNVSFSTDESLDTKITFKCGNHTTQSTVDTIHTEMFEKFSDCLYAVDDFSLQQVAVDLLKLHKRRLSVAESLTGGMISGGLVEVAGSSDVLNECCVTYSNEAKQSRLLVKQQTLSQYGAVSAETAYQMGVGLLNTSKCDTIIATTGIAGPTGGSDLKPVGLTFIAVGDNSGIHIHKLSFSGPRNLIRQKASKTALFLLIKFVKKHT